MRIALLFILAIGSVLPACAGVLYSTGFESPTFTTGPIAGQNGWAVFPGPTSAVQVESGVAESGSQAVEIIPSLAVGQTGPNYAITDADSVVELSAYIFLASSSTQSGWQFSATGAGLDGYIRRYRHLEHGRYHLTNRRTGDKLNHNAFTYGAWQFLDFVFDFTTQTYNFSLNGTLINSTA